MQLYQINNNGNHYCGPAVISAVAGIGTKEAAALIRQRTGRARVTGTHWHELQGVLSALGYGMDGVRIPLNSAAAYKTVNMRTWGAAVAKGKAVYLLHVGPKKGGHWVLVQGRHAICSRTGNLVALDDHPNARSFVQGARLITKVRTVDPAAVVPKKLASATPARRKAKLLAQANNIGLNRLNSRDPFPLEVWPYGGLADTAGDPYNGDHYAYSWAEALERVEKYAAIRAKSPDADPLSTALALATQHGITIEREDAENRTIWVYPPESISEDDDPHGDSHHVATWPEALARVREYVALLTGAAETA
jgi:hypothetical protein